MINLNSPKYKSDLFREDLLVYISDYDIFKYYIPNLQLNKAFHSPLRKDENPSFTVFFSKKYNMLLFKDLGTGERGDAFIFVSRLYNINYREAILQIITDFNLGNEFGLYDLVLNSIQPVIHDKEFIYKEIKDATTIKIKIRNWEDHDIVYWQSYGISLQTLQKYRVFPIKYIFLNNEIIIPEKYSYAYSEFKDSEIRFKIYQPYSKFMKWINNMIEGTLSGWDQLPKKGKYLIIASSLKDAMCLHDLGYKNVLCPQTENYIFKPHIIEALKNRFKNIIIFYDEDPAGNKAAKRMLDLYDIPSITTSNIKYKDPSDYYKQFGSKQLKKIIDNDIKKLLLFYN